MFWCTEEGAENASAAEFPGSHPVNGEMSWRAAGTQWAIEHAKEACELSRDDMFVAVQMYMEPRMMDLDGVQQACAGNAAYEAAWQVRLYLLGLVRQG